MGNVRGLSQHDDRPAERTVRLTSAQPAALIDWLFARGHAADIVLAVMAVEFVLLVARWRWRASDAALRLLPGALMIVALRAALTGAGWPAIALPIALSFPFHLADLRRRGGPGITSTS